MARIGGPWLRDACVCHCRCHCGGVSVDSDVKGVSSTSALQLGRAGKDTAVAPPRRRKSLPLHHAPLRRPSPAQRCCLKIRVKKTLEAGPRFELGSVDSKSNVLTVTPTSQNLPEFPWRAYFFSDLNYTNHSYDSPSQIHFGPLKS